jgi:hypothetical protein
MNLSPGLVKLAGVAPLPCELLFQFDNKFGETDPRE